MSIVTDCLQLLVHLLTPFSTRALLPLTAVSHRFHNIILRILHYRLLIAASLKEYKLILECYHPSRKSVEPIVYCTYLGTDGLSSEQEGEGRLYEDCESTGRLGRLGGLYSRFKPEPREKEVQVRRPAYTMGPVGSSNATYLTYPASIEARSHELVYRNINLDDHEMFNQLCAGTALVQPGPRPGVFWSYVPMADGVLRIWRHWLADQASLSHSSVDQSLPDGEKIGDSSGKAKSTSQEPDRMLWVDGRKNFGVRIKVTENKRRTETPLLIHRDEEIPVSYAVGLEGKSRACDKISFLSPDDLSFSFY